MLKHFIYLSSDKSTTSSLCSLYYKYSSKSSSFFCILSFLVRAISINQTFYSAMHYLAAVWLDSRHDLNNVYLHSRNVLSANSFQCDCEWSHQTVKHILIHCLNWMHLWSNMLRDVDFMNYRVIISITKSLKTTARMMMKTKLLKQFRMIRTLIL